MAILSHNPASPFFPTLLPHRRYFPNQCFITQSQIAVLSHNLTSQVFPRSSIYPTIPHRIFPRMLFYLTIPHRRFSQIVVLSHNPTSPLCFRSLFIILAWLLIRPTCPDTRGLSSCLCFVFVRLCLCCFRCFHLMCFVFVSLSAVLCCIRVFSLNPCMFLSG